MGTNFLSTDWVLDDDAAFFWEKRGLMQAFFFYHFLGSGALFVGDIDV